MSNTNKTLVPTWISAIAAVIGLVFGGGLVKAIDHQKINELHGIVESLKKPGQNPKKEQGFEFRLDNFRFADRNVVIELLVTSEERSQMLNLRQSSRLIDNAGNIYEPVEVLFGNSTNKGLWFREELPADVPVRITMKFDNISSKAESFNLFEVAVNNFKVAFSNGDIIDLMLADK